MTGDLDSKFKRSGENSPNGDTQKRVCLTVTCYDDFGDYEDSNIDHSLISEEIAINTADLPAPLTNIYPALGNGLTFHNMTSI